MAKIHITLVGGEPSPVYWAIKHSMPDVVVLVYSQESVKSAANVKRVISKNFGDKVQIKEALFGALDLTGTQSQVASIFKCYQNDDVEVNIASGPKMWTYYFVEGAKNMDNVSFVNIDQNCVFYNYTQKQQFDDIKFNMHDELSLHTEYDYNYFDDNTYDESDLKEIHKIESLRGFGSYEFSDLIKKMKTEFEHLHIKRSDDLESKKNIIPKEMKKSKDNSFILWNKETESFLVHLENSQGKIKEEKLESIYAFDFLFNGVWFELRVGELIKKCLECQEVIYSCEFKDGAESTQNEIDLIANIGKRLLFVECKTDVSKITDIDKFSSSARNYGGNGTRKLFITYEKLDETETSKCKNNRILHFSWKEDHDGLPPIAALEKYLKDNLSKSRL